MNCVRYLLVASCALAPLAHAVDLAATANPYTTVVTRNIFGLVPIPTNSPVEVAPPEPPVKITPNGIMSIFGKVQVLFKTPGKAKPGQPAKEESYVLCVGERQDEIEVLAIDEKEGKVKFNNHGIPQELALVAAANVPSPVVGGGGGPGGAVAGFRPPSMVPMPGGVSAATGGARFGRAARGQNVVSSEDLANANANLGGGGNPGANGHLDGSQNLSPEAQVIMIEANRAATQEAVNQGLMPPLPPTVLTPSDATGPGGVPLVNAPVNPRPPVAP